VTAGEPPRTWSNLSELCVSGAVVSKCALELLGVVAIGMGALHNDNYHGRLKFGARSI